jgi:hypothetical protein
VILVPKPVSSYYTDQVTSAHRKYYNYTAEIFYAVYDTKISYLIVPKKHETIIPKLIKL